MVYVSVFVSVSVSVSVFIFVLVFVFVFVSFTNENTIAIVLVIRNLLLLVLLFPPPLFIVVVLHHKTNIHDHPPRPFHRIYQSVSLMRRPGSFTLSLYILFRSCSCSSSSSSSFDRIYRSVSLLLCRTGLFLSLYVNPSLSRVVWYLFSSLYVSFSFLFFSIQPYQSIRLFIVSYWIFYSIDPSLYHVVPDLFLSL